MNKKNCVKSKLKMIIIVILSVLVVVLAAICARKIRLIQNEKNIIGTWVKDSSEEVFTFQDNGSLIVNQDIPEAGISSGNAYYEFVYMDTICVTQGDNSVEFEVKVSKNRLTIFFMGQECLVLEK